MTTENEEVLTWTGIRFDENWIQADTSKFDDLAPSWYKKRKEFEEGDEGYQELVVAPTGS